MDDDAGDDDREREYACKLASKGLLRPDDIKALSTAVFLSDNVINSAQESLRKEYGAGKGLQNVNLGQTLMFRDNHQSDSETFVQILHDGSCHWLAVTNLGCSADEVVIMDSLPRRAKRGRVLRPIIQLHVQQQIARIIRPESGKMKMTVAPVQRQSNGVDCGVFAVAFCQYVLQYNRYRSDSREKHSLHAFRLLGFDLLIKTFLSKP